MERRLGFGRDGHVYSTSARTAVKAHGLRESFERELLCYIRLKSYDVHEVRGLLVPQLIDADEELMVIEMSIVTRPFLLDFASAYLDSAPDFPEETMEEWYREKMEQFGGRWGEVQAVLEELKRRLGIHLLDIHPWNIAFAESGS